MLNSTFTLTTGSKSAVMGLRDTPLLVLGTMSGMGLGSQYAELDRELGGVISDAIAEKGFQGNLGKHFLLKLERNGAPRNVLVIGLGSPEKFNRKAINRVIQTAVSQAVKLGSGRMTIPVLPNRQTQGTLNLRGQAYIIREAVEQKLGQYEDKDGALEVEFLCTPQAKPQLAKGLACKRMGADGNCCE